MARRDNNWKVTMVELVSDGQTPRRGINLLKSLKARSEYIY